MPKLCGTNEAKEESEFYKEASDCFDLIRLIGVNNKNVYAFMDVLMMIGIGSNHPTATIGVLEVNFLLLGLRD